MPGRNCRGLAKTVTPFGKIEPAIHWTKWHSLIWHMEAILPVFIHFGVPSVFGTTSSFTMSWHSLVLTSELDRLRCSGKQPQYRHLCCPFFASNRLQSHVVHFPLSIPLETTPIGYYLIRNI